MKCSIWVLAIGLVLGACGSKDKKQSLDPHAEVAGKTALPEVAAAGDAHSMIFDAAGYEGAIGIALWPKKWPKLALAADALLRALPQAQVQEPLRMVRAQYLADADPWRVVHLATDTVGLGAFPETLPGIDESQPIVASLLRPLSGFEEYGERLVKSNDELALPAAGLHSRIVVPAVDSHAMAEAMATSLRAAKFAAEAESKHERLYSRAGYLVRLQAAKLFLVIDIVQGDRLGKLALDALDRGFGQGPTHAGDQLFASATPAALRVQLRHRHLEALGSFWGMRNVEHALGSVGQEMRLALLAAGYSEILSMSLMMDPDGRMNTDAVFEISDDDEPAVHAAFVLTDAGATALAKDSNLLGAKGATMREIDWLAIFASSSGPPALRDQATLRDASRLIFECGWVCMAYQLGPNAATLGRLWLDSDTAKAAEMLRTTLDLVQPKGAPDTRLTLEGGLLIVELVGGASSSFHGRAVPVVTHKPTASEACYRQAQRDLRKGLSVVSTVERSQYRTLLQQVLIEIEPSLRCAEKDPAFGERARWVRATLGQLAIAVGAGAP